MNHKKKTNIMTRRQFLKTKAKVGAAFGALGTFGPWTCSAPVLAESRKSLNPVKSPWFKELDNDKVQCQLCPHQCILEQGQRSPCRVRKNIDGQGYTLAFGNPALIQEDPVERKPFFHVLPGSRALSVSTAGCNLNCSFCEVWDMALVRPEEIHSYKMSPEEVIDHARSAGLDALSYAFGEPVAFYEYMHCMAGLAREAGMINLVHTAGYINQAPLRELCEIIDAANVDLKGFDPDFYRDYVGGDIEAVLETLKLMKKYGIHVEVTSIVIPTLNDKPEKIREMCAWIINELGEDTPLHFSRFYPLYRLSGLPRTPVSTLDMARETAMEAGLKYVYVAKVGGHEGENTFCPGCGAKVISRLGFIVEQVEMTDGRCRSCGHFIPGIWKKSKHASVNLKAG